MWFRCRKEGEIITLPVSKAPTKLRLDDSPIYCPLRRCIGLRGTLIHVMALLWGLKYSHRAPMACMPCHALQSNKYCSL